MIEMRWLESEVGSVGGPPVFYRTKSTLQYRDIQTSPYGDLATEWKDVPVVRQPTKPLNDRISIGHHGIST
jgi:hypothetical protein